MDGELTAAIAAVAVSVVGAGCAAWQACVARRAAASAKDQVQAAEAQVALMLRQIEGEETDRHETRGPQFVIEAGHVDTSNLNVPRGVLMLRQTSGPALSRVTAAASGEGVEGMRGRYNGESAWEYDREASVTLGPIAAGGTETVYVDLDYDTHKTKILLHLECYEPGASQGWVRSVASEVEPPPPRPRPRLRRVE